ncbi:hypothetical protein B0H14DRAFT_3103201 [Mycena olivaceomarginata]|nr:hypothetical protein B0H14DRAFT_3103201 [Mycena olivaceomarginata]
MVKHLPPAIKHLLTLRNPATLPAPPVSKLHAVLTSSYRSAKERNAETAWLVLTACSLTTANRPSTMAQLYRFVRKPDGDSATAGDADSRSSSGSIAASRTLAEAVNRAALIREAVLKSVIFIGVPRVILSFAAFNEALDPDVRAALRSKSRRDATSENISTTVDRGKALWRSIYAPHAEKLHDKLGSYHPDFISFIIQSYGAVLSPMPGETKSFSDTSGLADRDQGNISRAMGSVVGIACLRAEERVVLSSSKTRGSRLMKGTEWVIRTVDDIVDVVSEVEQDPARVKL